MLGRIFLVVVLLVVSLSLVKWLKTKLDEPPKQLKKDKSTEKNELNTVVKCLQCGLHIPEEEAIKQGDKVFCSLEHASKGL